LYSMCRATVECSCHDAELCYFVLLLIRFAVQASILKDVDRVVALVITLKTCYPKVGRLNGRL
jgi:hypothetical protein